MGLLDMLQQFTGGDAAGVEKVFDQVTGGAQADHVGAGLAEAFRSDQTAPFSQMVGQLFGQSNGAQQAGALNQIIAALGPTALSSVAGGALANVLTPGATQVTASQASQLTPDQVQEIAAHAEKLSPGIVDSLGRFYADHPTLVKTLGGAAMAIVANNIRQRTS